MILYKYRSLNHEYSVESILNKYLYFSRPSELNDPFDCQLSIDLEASDQETLEWIEKNKFKMKDGNKFSSIESFNIERKQGRALSFLQLLSQNIAETNHILSLTSNFHNEVMWGSYGGNYNGICIGYDFKDLSFTPTRIEATDIKTKRMFILPVTDKLLFEKVEYDYDMNHKLQVIKRRNTQTENATYSLTHKKKCWEYEEEYRAIYFGFDKTQYPNQIISTKFYYSETLLSEIIFGSKVFPQTIEDIISKVSSSYRNNVSFYTIQADYQKQILIKVPIK